MVRTVTALCCALLVSEATLLTAETEPARAAAVAVAAGPEYGPPLQEPISTSPAKILRHPERFDGQTVRISGRVVRVRSSRQISCRFNVADRRTAIGVVCTELACPAESAVTVDGVFRRVSVVHGVLIYNHVLASHVSCDGPATSGGGCTWRIRWLNSSGISRGPTAPSSSPTRAPGRACQGRSSLRSAFSKSEASGDKRW